MKSDCMRSRKMLIEYVKEENFGRFRLEPYQDALVSYSNLMPLG